MEGDTLKVQRSIIFASQVTSNLVQRPSNSPIQTCTILKFLARSQGVMNDCASLILENFVILQRIPYKQAHLSSTLATIQIFGVCQLPYTGSYM